MHTFNHSHSNLVTYLSRNIVLFGEVLRRHAHGRINVLVRQSIPEGIAHGQSSTQRETPTGRIPIHLQGRLRHVFRSSRQANASLTQLDGVGCLNDAFEPRAAQSVERESGRRDWCARLESYVTSKIRGIRRGLNDVPKVGGVNESGIDAGLTDGGFTGYDAEFRRREGLEGASESTKGCALGGNDEYSRHGGDTDCERGVG